MAKGRVPVIAGAGSNNTEEAVGLVAICREGRRRRRAGGDALLQQADARRASMQHYKAVDDAIGIPIIIYNIPPRSVIDMSVETMARLARACKNIVGVKDATGNLGRVSLQRQAHAAGLHPAFRRGRYGARLQRPWRARLHLGDRRMSRRGSAPSSRKPASPATMHKALTLPGPPDAAAHGAVHRDRARAPPNMRCRCSARWRRGAPAAGDRSAPTARSKTCERRWSMPGLIN